jgi:DNA-directed RNA polymerase subunit RPC12/RpoP
MEKITSHRMWCFECQKEFSTTKNLEDAHCIICKSQIIEKIETETDKTELTSQEILVSQNGKFKLTQRPPTKVE